MHDFWVSIKVCFSLIGFYLGAVVGPMTGAFIALCAFMVMDYITGFINACLTHTLSSEVGFKGLARKVFILVLVGVGHLLDTYVLGTAGVRTMVIFWFIANEGLSIVENAAALGLPVPGKLKDVLAQIGGKDNGNDADS